ncbi:hypothetical protein MPLB_1200066 [Mesorhizobium sp. ORS 3324]|nr:hypothetical protein MPLB_1200066 [Mesorhizobium sp. ORS 3324]
MARQRQSGCGTDRSYADQYSMHTFSLFASDSKLTASHGAIKIKDLLPLADSLILSAV